MRLTRKTIGLAAGAAALIVAAVLVLRFGGLGGKAVVPELEEQLDKVARIEVTHGGDRLAFERAEDGSWLVDSLGDAPALPGTVDTLLDGLAGITKADADNGKPVFEDSKATAVSLADAQGKSIAAFSFQRTQDTGDHGLVRLEPRGTVTAARGLPEISFAPDAWIKPALPVLGDHVVRHFKVMFPDGRVADYARGAPNGAFQPVAGNTAPVSPQAVEQASNALKGWAHMKVQSAKTLAWTGAPVIVAESFDGLVMTVMPVSDKAGLWVRVNAHYVPPAKADPASAKDVQAEAERLNRMRAFAFLLPAEQAEAIAAVAGAPAPSPATASQG